MFAQFFGAYLLNKEAVTRDQLSEAIQKLSDARIKLGTLAMHQSLMTASEVDEVCFIQTREDKRFGEIAVSRGYLTDSQVDSLLKAQTPDYLLLGQNLVDIGALSNTDLERLMSEYQSDTAIDDMSVENNDKSVELIHTFFKISGQHVNDETILYMNLLFNDLIRFVGSDFTPLAPVALEDYPIDFCVTQKVTGQMNIESRLDMGRDAAIQFASRYAKMDFSDFDEYVTASLEDFLNLHNGLFSVNMSNQASMELILEPPYEERGDLLMLPKNSFMLPVIFPFGTVSLIISFY